MTADDPSSLLSPIRERSAAALEFPMSGFAEDSIRACTQSAMDVPRLVKAMEDALKLADEWEATAATLDGGTARANALLDCTASFRAAITTALAGEETGDAG